ncbi:MAG: LysM peptidoglycan-binding domain-containing protein [Planctomycetota bacterium]|jgi:nucleoid-associated protein YgaU
MTSDAKIGLLLGLVFIFIIAFVINGLPRFRSATNGSEMTTNMVSLQNDTQPIGGRERQAPGVFDWAGQANKQTYRETQPVPEPKEDVRFKIQFPNDISVAKDTSIIEIAEEEEPTAPRKVEPTESKEVEPAVPVQIPEEKIEAKTPKPPGPARPKVYVVTEGDTLADIAKKFYGPEEGNKRANIARIFEANRNLLETVDDIFVGQKLAIPPLVTSQAVKKETRISFADSILEKVKSIGKKRLPPRPAKATKSAPYIVREDDNLWRIATEQLGDGSRYREISRLNDGILKNDNDLTVGMLLRMPAR